MSERPARPRAIVFGYHDVGVRCLRVLIDAGVDVSLVVTHEDSASEAIWFGSVEQTAHAYGIPCVAPEDPHMDALLAQGRELAPDFIFSFYYRRMLKASWLDLARRGAYNMHGSMLPAYRGRAPVNWAILRGERSTGATLHRMNEKPDNGAIVDQCAVPILGDDTAREVFAKVVVAAEIVLARSLPALIAGTAVERPQDLRLGGYFGGRTPEDGRIAPEFTARQIHDLVRALAPPFPGAFVSLKGRRVLIDATRHSDELPAHVGECLRVLCWNDALWLRAADGRVLRVLAARDAVDGGALDAHAFMRRFGAMSVPIER